MKNLAQILILGCLFLTSSIFSQNSSIDFVSGKTNSIIRRILPNNIVLPEREINESIENINYLQIEEKIDQPLSVANEEVEFEYEYEYEEPKKQLSSNSNTLEIEYEEEYEYETVDTQLSDITSNSYEEYEYELPKNQLINFSNDPEAEYEYE